jgi:hypothetical protein
VVLIHRFPICCHSGIIAEMTKRATSQFVDATCTEPSGGSWHENRNRPSDRKEENTHVFDTDGEARWLRSNE